MNNSVQQLVEDALELNLQMQMASPQGLIYTMLVADNANPIWNMGVLDEDSFSDDETFKGKRFSLDALCGMRVKVSNFELDLFDGSNPFDCDIMDDTPRLLMRLVFWENEPTLSAFKELAFFEKFKEVVHTTQKGERLYQYFADYGTDIDSMADTFILVLSKVYGLDLDDMDEDNISTEAYSAYIELEEYGTKERMREALRTYGIPYYKMPPLNCKMHVSKDALAEMRHLVDEYNATYSQKLGCYYELIEERQVLLKRLLPLDESKKVRTNIISTMKRGNAILNSQELEGKIYTLGATTWKN